MKYDFDAVIDRSHSGAMKYSETAQHFGVADVLPMWVADMDFCTAPCVVQALTARAAHGIFGYTYRDPALYEAVRDWQKRRHGYDFDPARMSYSPGIVPGMRLMLQLFTQPGDAVIVQQPVYYPFTDIVENTGRRLAVNPLRRTPDGRYEMDYEDLEQKAAQGARFLLLCNPHNPVGRCWSRQELQRAGEICLRHGVEIISDEIHADLMLDGHRHTVMASVSPEISAITTTCTSASKTFNLAGLQCATLIFNTEEKRERYFQEMRKMDLARGNSFALVGSIAAYRGGEAWLDQLLDYLSGNMRLVSEFCAAELPQVRANRQEATYLAWLDLRALGLSDDALMRLCVEKAGVALSGGASFGAGGSGFMRMNVGCPRSVVEQALRRLKAAL